MPNCSTPGHEDREAVEAKILFGREFQRCAECAGHIKRSENRQKKAWSQSASRAMRAQGEYFRRR